MLHRQALASYGLFDRQKQSLDSMVKTHLACSVAALGSAPGKLNSVIHALLSTLEGSPTRLEQKLCATALSRLIRCCSSRRPSPNEKVRVYVAACAYWRSAWVADPWNCRRRSCGMQLVDILGKWTEEGATEAHRAAGLVWIQELARVLGEELLDALPSLHRIAVEPIVTSSRDRTCPNHGLGSFAVRC